MQSGGNPASYVKRWQFLPHSERVLVTEREMSGSDYQLCVLAAFTIT